MKALPEDLAAVARRLKQQRSFAIAVHQNPDADAFGAASGLYDFARQCGALARLHMVGEPAPEAADLLLPEVEVLTTPPEPGTPLWAVDSGSLARLALGITSWDGPVVNIDHHHDNTRFGDLDLVRPHASSTSEIVCDLGAALDLTPSLPAATALYAGISFDTGHFRHECTSAHTFVCVAWLVESGVSPTAVFRRLYERRSLASLKLWGHAVAAATSVADGRGLISTLTLDDFRRTGADEHDTEGIVEALRTVDGVQATAVVREQSHGSRVRVSLRSTGLDVSAVAALRGGGGHVQAAGFSSDDAPEEVTAWLSTELARRLSTDSC